MFFARLKFAHFAKFVNFGIIILLILLSSPQQAEAPRRAPDEQARRLARGGALRGRERARAPPGQRGRPPAALCGLGFGLAKLGKLAKFCKFLAGSFSAVSKRNFARKYAFDSIFQALQGLHTFAPLQSQNFRKKSV